MKHGRYSDKNKESWEEFEKRVGMKRTGLANAKHAKVPEALLVQRMSSLPIGKGKNSSPWTLRILCLSTIMTSFR